MFCNCGILFDEIVFVLSDLVIYVGLCCCVKLGEFCRLDVKVFF